MARKRAKAQTGLEVGPDGTEIGRDPRRLAPDALRTLGHRAAPLLQVMRRRCVDCCGGKTDEVRRCTAVGCPLWPYRMATDPWREVRTGAADRAVASAPAVVDRPERPSTTPHRLAGADGSHPTEAEAASPAPPVARQPPASAPSRRQARRSSGAEPTLPFFEDADSS